MAEIIARVDSLEATVRGGNSHGGLVGDVRVLQDGYKDVRESIEAHRCEIYGTLTTPGLKADVKALTDFKQTASDFMDDIRGMFTKLVLAVLGTVVGGILIQVLMDYLKFRASTP